jgi:signal transduction histidine kinase
MKNIHAPEIQHAAPDADASHRLNGNRSGLASRYRCALNDYLGQRRNEGLQAARALGCVALRSGMGVFDMARLHEDIVATALTFEGTRDEAEQRARAAENFLLDALSPFETARRGLPEAYLRLGRLNEKLERRNRALATIDARRHSTEEALQESKERCSMLFQQARSMKEDIRQNSARMIQAQEEERKRISRELHDEIGQILAAMNVGLVMLKKHAGHDLPFQRRVADTQALLEQSMESVHRFARELRPEMLDLFGPYEAIRSYVRAFAERTGIRANMESKVDLGGLDSEQEIALFRVAQESLTNISKHAHATRIDVRIRRLAQAISMEIQDNGRAFSVEDKLGKKGENRLGIMGMQERVRLVRGDFSIESAPGSGTKVRVQFPLARNNGASSNGNGDRAPLNESGLNAAARGIL